MRINIIILLGILILVPLVSANIPISIDQFDGTSVNWTLWQNQTDNVAEQIIEDAGVLNHTDSGGGGGAIRSSNFSSNPSIDLFSFGQNITYSFSNIGICNANANNETIYLINGTIEIPMYFASYVANSGYSAGTCGTLGVKYGNFFKVNSTTVRYSFNNSAETDVYVTGNIGFKTKVQVEPNANAQYFKYDWMNASNLPVSVTTTLNSPSNNTGIVTGIFNITSSVVGPGNLTNVTVFIYNSTNDIVNQTTKTITGTSNNTAFNITNLYPGNYYWNALSVATNGSAIEAFGSANRTFFYGLLINSQTYNAISFSGTTESFLINITYDSSVITGISASLYYNNTVTSGTLIGSGNTVIYNATLNTPTVTSAINKSFFWNFALASTGPTGYYNTSSLNQTINLLSLDNCSTNSKVILDYKLFDEDGRYQINGTIKAVANLYTYGTTALVASFNRTFNFVANYDNAQICIADLNSTYRLDYEVQYVGNTSYVTEYKFAQNIQLYNNTAPQNVSLFDLLSSRSTSFAISLTGSDLSTISGAVIDIQRQYVASNEFVSVESPLTDNAGRAIAHLVAEEGIYNFIVTKDGEILGTFENYQVKCNNVVTGDCPINLNLIQSSSSLDDFQYYGNISVNYNLNKVTRVLSMSYQSTDGLTHTVNMTTIKFDNFANDTICSTQASGTSGTFTCTIPSSYGNTSIYTELYSDGIYLGNSYFSLADATYNVIGGSRVVFALLMYSTLTLLLIAHPILIVVGSVLGMIFAAIFYIVDGGTVIGGTAILAWFIIAAAIIIYYLRRR